MKKIGLDTEKIEEIQICPNGRGVINITLKSDVDIGKYCSHDVIEVTADGIRAVHAKPAGRREVIATLKGLHPNTREEVVFEYLGKFAKVNSGKVVYSLFKDGPLKGLRNGDRNYKLEIKPNTNIGSYHIIDGHKVNVRYPGQLQTCGRCLMSSRECRGRGVARVCETEGGVKADFGTYILNLWQKIGYQPKDYQEIDVSEVSEVVKVQEGGIFTPLKETSETGNFTGVLIKGFSKDVDQGEIVELLVRAGLPESQTESIHFSSSGSIQIKDLDNTVCTTLITALHRTSFENKRIFCNGIIQLTPEKRAEQAETE